MEKAVKADHCLLSFGLYVHGGVKVKGGLNKIGEREIPCTGLSSSIHANLPAEDRNIYQESRGRDLRKRRD